MGLLALKAEGYNHIHYKPGGQIHFAPIFFIFAVYSPMGILATNINRIVEAIANIEYPQADRNKHIIRVNFRPALSLHCPYKKSLSYKFAYGATRTLKVDA